MSMEQMGPSEELESASSAIGTLTVLRGLAAIAFGLIALANPGAAAGAFVLVFAVWAFVDAALAFTAAFRRGREHGRWGWLLFEGLVSVGAGVASLMVPGITLLVLVFIIGIRAILLGGLLMASGVALKNLPVRWLPVVTGLVSFAFGVLLVVRPRVGTLALVWTIGIYAVVSGLVSLVHGIEVIGMRHRLRSA